MSNIYIQEPPTSGKVLLKTSVGDIDIELWTRECPKACRNFIQLCMEGYYNGTIFHRVVKGFIVQGGDPNGDGTGGESIYGAPFKDEFHSRLRYVRRGLVGMANSDIDDNASQFFFTMAPTPELQNKNTLFGKVTGDTVFNMLKLEEGLVDHTERPMYPHKIIKTEILHNPFDDIVPRTTKSDSKKEKRKKKEKGVKNFGLLSFGEEAEEDEEESNTFAQKNAGKAKSLHDVVDDPKLSKEVEKIERGNTPSDIEDYDGVSENETTEEKLSRIKNKLKMVKKEKPSKKPEKVIIPKEEEDSDEDVLMTSDRKKEIDQAKKKEVIREEILTLKKQYQSDKKAKDKLLEMKIEKEIEVKPESSNEMVKDYIDEKVKYTTLNQKLPKKGPTREQFTLDLLKKFRNKLETLKQNTEYNDNDESLNDANVEKEIQGDDWLAHTLRFEQTAPILAKDASTKSDDWYDAYDPRNPLNKRKRGENHRSQSSSKKTR
ncbi:spliceosome-associated protein CWC27 homolog [Episyrphus balteatus]|uniref:spliceosome-associated protein CWC27 homolog n=1 Tax=Episyrphus balteatus TaxID=286459 RepID=UPI002484ECC1|nr:spliceosome-associated protein CWC27 homolog [Episyrphus balteatus]